MNYDCRKTRELSHWYLLFIHLLVAQQIITCLALEQRVTAAGGERRQQLQVREEFTSAEHVGNEDGQEKTYGVIVDCGSSGSRANIYQWDSQLSYPELLHDIAPMRDENGAPVSQKFEPGLSSLADKSTDDVHAYIKQVADYIYETIPRDRHDGTVIYMLATAGMRLLDSATQDRIMADARTYVKQNYDFLDVQAKVIPGADEGMYQWISVNAKAKRFLGKQTSGLTRTYAVIEMGGASAQITYQLSPEDAHLIRQSLPDQVRSVYSAQLRLPALSRPDKPENTYLLHSTTFLGFGGDSARELYLDLLIRKHYTIAQMRIFIDRSRKRFGSFLNPSAMGKKDATAYAKGLLTIKDPCLPKGYKTDRIKKPRRMLNRASTQTIGYIAEDDEPTFWLRARGTGQHDLCRKYVEEMVAIAKKERLNCKPNEDANQCTMALVGERFIPYLFKTFGVGDIFHTTNTMLDLAGPYNHEAVVAKTKKICQMPYAKLKTQYAEIANNKNSKIADRITGECFKAVWVDTFLEKVLLLPPSSLALRTVGRINGDDLEWTLGAVIDNSLAISQVERKKVLLKTPSFRELLLEVNDQSSGNATEPIAI